ncbi:A/G-specific adenine glycosylase [Ornithinibacillus halotolerans]|uniref:Adenine DNA glycosylase n=1 Tax=Ornithinibacillus halotolerans TaxID=1274357 RepID=A0A916WD98_9BACI|nr:A/G-specific adenine glycosylase [Ornithinibacillus halotolerans]GGA89287.1 adenine DNA glycosylase [Ornithinibacillus halotolerans]
MTDPKTSLQNFNIKEFQNDLLTWYYANKRDLPWRRTNDPYKVWVSEIMLQQTKVDTVIPYFYNFIEQFPTVYDLANAEEQEVLKAWEGLGYYSRARNLQHAVREVVERYDGKVPSKPKELEGLKGIGSYTKGAILSIAFNQPEPAVDGNVMRVFSRVLNIDDDIAQAKTKKLFETLTREVISHEDPSSFNQAIMDLGATICTPKSPTCLLCPVQEHCRAFDLGVEQQLPIKSKAKKNKTQSYAVLLIENEQGEIGIEQRPEEGLLANLWQYPMVPLEENSIEKIEEWIYSNHGFTIKLGKKQGELKHVFSHLTWNLDIYTALLIEDNIKNKNIKFVPKQELINYPFPVSHLRMKQYI